jgi:hypothetical protein
MYYYYRGPRRLMILLQGSRSCTSAEGERKGTTCVVSGSKISATAGGLGALAPERPTERVSLEVETGAWANRTDWLPSYQHVCDHLLLSTATSADHACADLVLRCFSSRIHIDHGWDAQSRTLCYSCWEWIIDDSSVDSAEPVCHVWLHMSQCRWSALQSELVSEINDDLCPIHQSLVIVNTLSVDIWCWLTPMDCFDRISQGMSPSAWPSLG